MRTLGRWMQVICLVAPPLTIILQLAGAIRLGQMLLALVASVAGFYIGRIVEGYAQP